MFAKKHAYILILTKYIPLILIHFTIESKLVKLQIFQNLMVGFIQTILMLDWILNCKVDKLSSKHEHDEYDELRFEESTLKQDDTL